MSVGRGDSSTEAGESRVHDCTPSGLKTIPGQSQLRSKPPRSAPRVVQPRREFWKFESSAAGRADDATLTPSRHPLGLQSGEAQLPSGCGRRERGGRNSQSRTNRQRYMNSNQPHIRPCKAQTESGKCQARGSLRSHPRALTRPRRVFVREAAGRARQSPAAASHVAHGGAAPAVGGTRAAVDRWCVAGPVNRGRTARRKAGRRSVAGLGRAGPAAREEVKDGPGTAQKEASQHAERVS